MITKKTKWLLIGLLCLALWPGTTRGQSSEYIDTYDRFARFYTQGRAQEALRFAEKAMRLGEYEFGPDHPITGLRFNNLALLYQAQGHYPKRAQLDTPTRNQRMPASRVAFGTTSYFVKGGRNVPEG